MITLLASIFSSSRGDVTVWAATGAGAGVYLFYRGFRLLQRRRLILNIPASKVRSASLGLVEVNGLAVGPYTMPAPITAVPCYYYHTLAWELRQSGKNKEWHKVADESLHVPFYLDDNTGRVLVDPRGAETDLHRDFHEEYRNSLFSTSLDIPATVSGFLARHGISSDRAIKIDEYCIKPKNALFILGTLAENPGLTVNPTPVRDTPGSMHSISLNLGTVSPGAAAAMDALPGIEVSRTLSFSTFTNEPTPDEIVRLSPENQPSKSADMTSQGKIAAAMMKAGITSPAAWAAAGVAFPAIEASAGVGVTAPVAAENFDLNPQAVLMKGTNNPAFFISWRSQREVVQSLGWQSALMIWGGPALTLLCLYYMALRYGWL